MSSFHKAIIGGAFPNHVFDVSDLPKYDVNTVIAATSELVNINKAMKVNISVIFFQSTSSGVLPSVIIADKP